MGMSWLLSHYTRQGFHAVSAGNMLLMVFNIQMRSKGIIAASPAFGKGLQVVARAVAEGLTETAVCGTINPSHRSL
jgi:hypothetical protein